MLTQVNKGYYFVLTLAAGLLLSGCSGSSDPVVNTFIGAGGDPPGIVGNLNSDTGPVSHPTLQPIQGQLGSAPLGTNPEYEVQEADSVIETHKVSSTSSVGKGASEENPMLWVAVTQHGQDPIPASATGPFSEGDKVDLYMRYVVNPGELTIERNWFIQACGLDFTDAYTHPEAGTYEAVFPFYLPYGSGTLAARFYGGIRLPKAPSVFTVSDYEGTSFVEFDIENVPVLPPVYLPEELPRDNGGSHACMPDWNSITVYPDLHVETTDKGVGAVVYVFDPTPLQLFNDDEVVAKYSGLSGSTYDPYAGKGEGNLFPPVNPATGMQFAPEDCVIVFVHSGCNASGYGPGFGWRFDAPFGQSGESNQIPTAQIVVEETVPVEGGVAPDYDYNDFVGQFRSIEMYMDPGGESNNSGILVQIDLTIYAQACSVLDPGSWQLNIDCDLIADVEVQAMVQLYNNENPKGESIQHLYYSNSGFSVPIFHYLDNSLDYPEGYASVNCDPGSYPTFVEGDWAEITITFGEPVGTGGYVPYPYVPVMWIGLDEDGVGGEGVYSIGFWKEKGDELNADGMPQAMLLPDTYAWPLEGVGISQCYDGFDYWIEWLNAQQGDEPLFRWYDDNPPEALVFTREKFAPPPAP